jgi:hypothetical protein
MLFQVKQAAKVLFNVDIRMIVTERSYDRRNEILTEHIIFTLESEDEFTPLSNTIATKDAVIPKVLFNTLIVYKL